MKHSFRILILLIVSLVTLDGGCRELGNAKPAAETAIAEFHRQFNDGKVMEIYQSADPRFREATSEDEFIQLMSAVDRKLGKVNSTTNQNWNVKTFNTSTTIVMIQKTEFEQSSGVETFTFAIDADKAVLLGYHISSSDLITK